MLTNYIQLINTNKIFSLYLFFNLITVCQWGLINIIRNFITAMLLVGYKIINVTVSELLSGG